YTTAERNLVQDMTNGTAQESANNLGIWAFGHFLLRFFSNGSSIQVATKRNNQRTINRTADD
ncbi:MAG: hypothetical protein ACK56W_09120, partial [Pirellula sp.]